MESGDIEAVSEEQIVPRRRKQTVMLDQPLDVATIEAEDDVGDTTENNNMEDREGAANVGDDHHVDHDGLNKENHEYDRDEKLLRKHNGDTNVNGHLGDNAATHVEPKVEKNSRENNTQNDIVYDETKPKRLSNARKLKLNVNDENQGPRRLQQVSPRSTLHDSINILISPDEPESPTKRKRRVPSIQTPSQHDVEIEMDDRDSSPSVKTDYLDTNSIVPDIERGQHYQRSPETARRKLSHRTSAVVNDHNNMARSSSPVERMIHRQSAQSHTVQTNIQRKHSSGARLVGTQDNIRLTPKRKISLEANIEAQRYNQPLNTAQDFRRRKVSFDTTALVNGNRLLPLNDDISVRDASMLSEDRDTNGEDSGIFFSPVKGSEQSTDDYNESDDKDQLYDDTNDDRVTQVHNECYENEAFSYEDEQQMQQVNNDVYYSKGYTDDNSPAVIGYTNIQDERYYNEEYDSTAPVRKVSDSRLKKLSTQSDDSGVPKSILKVRKEDTESMVSEESVYSAKLKVRKDSIALFTDRNGEVQLQALRNEYSKPWKRFGRISLKQMWMNRHDYLQKYKLHIFVLLLFLMTLTFVLVGLHYHSEYHEKMEIARKIFFDARKRVIDIFDPHEKDAFSGILGQNIPSWKQPTHCYNNYADLHDRTCLKWKNYAKLDVIFSKIESTNCYMIQWEFQNGHQPYDCFKLESYFWYGPSNSSRSEWPLRSQGFKFSNSQSNFHSSGTFSRAFEYYWISSSGASILVDSKIPLEINWNDRRHGYVCFIGSESKTQSVSEISERQVIKYTMCNGLDIRSTHDTITQKYLPVVQTLPKKELLESPHWSTVWDSNQFTVNESIIENIAHHLKKNELECSTVEIDGKWEDHYGDLTFDEEAFPNITDTLDSVRSIGCNISLNIYPYVSFQSKSVKDGTLTYDYFIKDGSRTVPALVNWQHELSAMLDISNPLSREWLTTKVKNLTNLYNLKTFRLSYGVSDWFPNNPKFHIDETTPGRIKYMFSELMTSLGETIVQTTSRSQNITTLIGIVSDVEEDENTGQTCLTNIIPDVLHLGLTGYPFVMADGFSIEKKMNDEVFYLPKRNIFVNWMLMASFFPAMRYTIKPWLYDSTLVDLAKNLTKFHKDIVVKAFYEFEPNMLEGEPFIQPLWWIDPHDATTYTIGNQFVAAGKYLVAPILCDDRDEDGNSVRDIYVPRGLWMDVASKAVARGPMWIRDHKTPKYTIPYFEKMPEIS